MKSNDGSVKVLSKYLFDGVDYHHDVVMSIRDGLIIDLHWENLSCDIVLEDLVAPGFVDLQVNGGGGVLFNAAPTIDSLQKMMAAHSQFGTTAMLPTVITDNVDVMSEAADAVGLAIANKNLGIVGIHFEGPHISIAKKGAHSKEFIRPISEEEWQIFERTDIGHILVTLAPEAVSAEDIQKLVSLGVHVCIGHSNATFECADKGLKAGATGFTHLFNAMSGINARHAGVAGCALLNDRAQCGLIVDGLHVSEASCKLALKIKPRGGIFLVTDAMPPVGSAMKEFEFFGRTVTNNHGKLTSSTGELAGSVLDMATAVRNCIKTLGVEESEAIRMGSLYPLSYLLSTRLPISPLALLKAGKPANFIQLDNDFCVKSTWIEGQCVYGRHSVYSHK
ncbi:N-acetylglucosamine-6-phosphate deacetylase [Glaciecola sp. SC05]|uniref:N-acetylglucosamine-6-phosphate deacetylase n=1 Tax=Glaciecola sp. SC05 TaxID=1987355 RepID=UPI0035298E75